MKKIHLNTPIQVTKNNEFIKIASITIDDNFNMNDPFIKVYLHDYFDKAIYIPITNIHYIQDL